jgi:hypothetical protein
MTETTTQRVFPTDPKEVAKETLRLIRLNWDRFDMGTWCALGPEDEVEPNGDFCGTTMCSAGWTVYAAGWKIKNVLARFGEGGEWVAMAVSPVDGREYNIPEAAREILDLRADQTFWFASEETALDRLQAIADGHPVSNYRGHEVF